MNPATETVEPLTAVEAALILTVGSWRDEQIARIHATANQRIAPVLVAHGVTSDDWEIRPDKASASGQAIVKLASATAVAPSRAERRRNQRAVADATKQLAKATSKGAQRG